MKKKSIEPQKYTCTLNEKGLEGKPIICNHEIYDKESGLCIFHCKEKPLDEFKYAFLKILERANNDNEVEEIDCSFFVFPSDINFRNLDFKKEMYFYRATFGENTSFDEATFVKNTNFSFATFGAKTNFSLSTFGENTNFYSAVFGENTAFTSTTFGTNTDFSSTKFGKNTDFFFAKFGEKTDFSIATFGDTTFFTSASFESYTVFNFATFGAHTDFTSATFGKNTSFFAVKFEKYACFSSAKFNDNVDFSIACFKDVVDFSVAIFNDNVNFSKATFWGNTNFSSVIFGENTSFMAATFNGVTIFAENKFKEVKEWSIDFTNLKIVKPADFRFNHFNLGKVELLNTDWTNVEFLGCTWAKVNGRNAVYDEILDTERKSLASIEQLYNRLQTNFENSKRYAEAGDFYIGAMEMRRLQIAEKSKKTWWRKTRQNLFSVMAFYRRVSLYGENYVKPLYWLAAFLVVFPFIFLQTGFDYFDKAATSNQTLIEYTFAPDFSHLGEFFSDYVKGFVISFHATAFQRESRFFELGVWGNVFYILQSVLSATIITLFLLALRRKFGRK